MKGQNSAAVLGALVADSASLGLHWIYDSARIADIEPAGGIVFLQPNANNYSGVKGYFAHRLKAAGESTSYGETCLLMLRHMAKHGDFKRVEYQSEYLTHFGPGGEYVGYIDTPTRVTLHTLSVLEPAEFPAASGADDDQHPALATLPALVAAHRGTLEELMARVEEAVRITNNNELAVSGARCASAALFKLLHGMPLAQALSEASSFAGRRLEPLLAEALAMPQLDSVAAAERFGASCHVSEGLPLVFHIAQRAPDYRSAVESNIRAGGDSCGRSIMLGAIAAAHDSMRNPTEFPIPLSWLARYWKFEGAAEACAAL